MNHFRTLVAAVLLLGGAPAQFFNFDYGVGSTPLPPTIGGMNPFNTYYNCGYTQVIYTAAQLTAAGIPPGARIDATQIIVDNPANLTWHDTYVSVAHTTMTSFSFYAPLGSNSFPPEMGVAPLRDPQPWTDVGGWNIFESTREFYWNGYDNLAIEIGRQGGTDQYPNGTTFGQPFFGPTIRGTTYPNPEGAASRVGTASASLSGYPPDAFACLTLGNGHDTPFDMRLVFTFTPLNDDCRLRYILPEGNFALSLAHATTTPGLPGAPTLENDVWFGYANQTNVTRVAEVSTCSGAAFDSVIAVYTGVCESLQLVAFDDDGCGVPGGSAKVSFTAPPGQQFSIVVGRKAGSAPLLDGSYVLSMSTAAPAVAASVGAGCGFGGAPVTLSGTTPVMGSLGVISVTGAPPSSFVVLLLGGAPGSGVPFLDSGCPLYLDPAAMLIFRFGITDAIGSWSLAETLPNSPALAGVVVGLQAAIYSPFNSPSTAMTNALRLTFGI